MATTIEVGCDDGQGGAFWPSKGYELVDGQYQYIGHENDGTDPQMSHTVGCPHRLIGAFDCDSWERRVRGVKQLLGQLPNTGGIIRLTPDILKLINSIPLKGKPIDVDRAIWLKYWTNRAITEFGDKAVIQLR